MEHKQKARIIPSEVRRILANVPRKVGTPPRAVKPILVGVRRPE